jgi:hypothetical protein
VKGREQWDQMGKRTGQPQSRGPGEEQFIKHNNCHNNNNNNNNNKLIISIKKLEGHSTVFTNPNNSNENHPACVENNKHIT